MEAPLLENDEQRMWWNIAQVRAGQTVELAAWLREGDWDEMSLGRKLSELFKSWFDQLMVMGIVGPAPREEGPSEGRFY
jgi:hypothetical protein